MEMIHALVTISPIEHRFADANRTPKTFEMCGLHRVACEQRALDLYGDYCRVTGYTEFAPAQFIGMVDVGGEQFAHYTNVSL